MRRWLEATNLSVVTMLIINKIPRIRRHWAWDHYREYLFLRQSKESIIMIPTRKFNRGALMRKSPLYSSFLRRSTRHQSARSDQDGWTLRQSYLLRASFQTGWSHSGSIFLKFLFKIIGVGWYSSLCNSRWTSVQRQLWAVSMRIHAPTIRCRRIMENTACFKWFIRHKMKLPVVS